MNPKKEYQKPESNALIIEMEGIMADSGSISPSSSKNPAKLGGTTNVSSGFFSKDRFFNDEN